MPAKISDSRPGEKLLMLYTLLMRKGEHHTSLGDLSQCLGCSKQTTLRLLDQLEASGYGKLDEPLKIGRQNFYRLLPADHTLLNVGVEELAQLALCRNLLLSIMPGPENAPETVMAPDARAEIITKGRIDYTAFQRQYGQLMQALRAQRVCLVIYRKHPRMEGRRFAFAPMRLISYHETISFIGWEVNARGTVEALYENSLTLHLHRFTQVRLTQRSCAHLAQPSHSGKDGNRAFGIMNGKTFTARIRFAPAAAAYVHDRQWSMGQKLSWEEDGSLVLELMARSPLEIRAWILSFGSSAQVLSPDWLRKETQKEISAMSGLYSAS